MDNKLTPRLIRVKIKQSKTDPFRQGVTLFLGKTGSPICPVDAILPYLAVRDNRPGPLFIFQDCCMLTRQTFSTLLDNVLDHPQENLTLTALELEPQLQQRKLG